MSHLNLRTRPEDEQHITLLKQIWGLDRSEVARRALAEAAAIACNKHVLSRKEVLETSNFVGCMESTESIRTNYKKKIKESLKQKYKRAFKK